MGGRDSLVCLARCRLDGLGIEFPVAATFFAPDHAGPEVHPASCTIGTVPGPFSELERPRFGLEFPPPPKLVAMLSQGDAIILPHCVPSWHVIGGNSNKEKLER